MLHSPHPPFKAPASFVRLSKQPSLSALSLQLSMVCSFTSVLHLLFQLRPQPNIHLQLRWANSLIGRPQWILKSDTFRGRWTECLRDLTQKVCFLWLLLLLSFLFPLSFDFLSTFVLYYIFYCERDPLFRIAVPQEPLGKHSSIDLYVLHMLIVDK